jgi:hypothetical protein
MLAETCLELFDHGNTYMRTIKKQLDARLKSMRSEKAHEPAFRVASVECFRHDVAISELESSIPPPPDMQRFLGF